MWVIRLVFTVSRTCMQTGTTMSDPRRWRLIRPTIATRGACSRSAQTAQRWSRQRIRRERFTTVTSSKARPHSAQPRSLQNLAPHGLQRDQSHRITHTFPRRARFFCRSPPCGRPSEAKAGLAKPVLRSNRPHRRTAHKQKHAPAGYAAHRCASAASAWTHRSGRRAHSRSRNERNCSERVGWRSLRSALASIWRIRSRVTSNCLPTSSSV